MTKRVVFLIFLTFSFQLKADFYILDNKKRIDVFEEYIFKDSTQKLGIEQINKINKGFIKSTPEVGFVTDFNANYWLRFKISNPSKQGLILYRAKDFQEFRVFEIQKETITEINPFYFKNDISNFFKKQQFVFYLPKSDSTSIYFAKLVPVSDQFIGISIQTIRGFYAKSTSEIFYYGIFFGLIFLMMLYNFIHFLFNKERINLYYSFFLFGLIFFALGVWSILPFNLFSSKYMYFSYTFFHATITISLIMCAYHFFEFGVKYKKEQFFLLVFVFLKLLLLSIQLLLPNANKLVYSPIYDLGMIGYCTWFGIKYHINEKFTPALFFALGLFFIFIAFFHECLVDLLALIGFLISFFTNYTYNVEISFYSENENILFFTGVIQVLFFAISMSNRYRVIKSMAISAQKQIIAELESKQQLIDNQNKILENTVEERTVLIRNQSIEIARINQLLLQQNNDLKDNVTKITQNRVLVKPISFEEFKAAYPSDDICYNFLINLKWNQGYKCKKCNNQTYSETDKDLSRRCTKCNYIESPTAHTIFHHLRFPIVKAFYIVFLVYTRKGITIEELSKMLDLRAGTCHSFKQKISEVMQKKKVAKRNLEGWSSYVLD